MKQFTLEIVTPEKNFFSGKVEAVSMDTLSGRIQILGNHIPSAAGLLPSIIKIKENDETKLAVISGGFFEFNNNKALILADSAEWPEEINKVRAQEALDRAKMRIKSNDNGIDRNRAKMALMRASKRLKASEMKESR